MAKFNPDIPDVVPAPRYTIHATQPISEFKGDMTGGTAISGIGNVLGDVIKGADFLVKDTIDKFTHAAVDKERDAYSAALDEDKANITGQTVTDYGRPQGQPLEILPGGSDASVPGPVVQGLKTLGNLGTAQEGGKTSETFYYGRLNAIAKDLRSEYPGYRDYIDQKVSQITGGNPANEYIRSIIGDINKAQAGVGGEAKEIHSFLRANMGLPNADKIMAAYRAGQIGANEVYSWAQPYLKQKRDLEMYDLTHKAGLGVQEEDSVAALRAVNNHVALSVQGYLNTLSVMSNTGTPEKLTDFLRKQASGETPLASSTQYDQLVTKMKFERDALVASEKAEANKINPVTGMSKAATINDPKKLDDTINSQVAVLDAQISYLGDKNFSPAFFLKRFAEHKIDEVGAKILQDEGVGANVAMTAWLAKNSGPFGKDFFTQGLVHGMSTKMNTLTNSTQMKLITQPDKDIRVTGDNENIWTGAPKINTGIPYTFNQSVTDTHNTVARLNNDTPGTVSPEAEKLALADIAGFGKNIADPTMTDPAKYRLAKAYFDPSNRGVISRFDPDSGMKIFQNLTSQPITEEIRRLSKQDPQLWINYKDWAETEFGRTLFVTPIKNLAAIQEPSNMHPKTTFTWDTEHHQWGPPIFDRTGFPHDMATDQYIKTVQDNVAELNKGLKSIANIATAEKGDADAYVLGLMRQSGFAPGGGSLPEQLLDAVITGHKPPEETKNYVDPYKTKTKGKSSERIAPGTPYQFVTSGQ